MSKTTTFPTSLNNTDLSDLQSRILYEDNHLVVINKKAGEIVQGDRSGDYPLLEGVRDYLRVAGNKLGNVFCGLIHRIDRPVSGAVIFARTSKAHARMCEQLKQRVVSKIYWAIIEGTPPKPEDHLIHYLRKNEKLNKSFAATGEIEGWYRSELEYKTLATSPRYSLLEIQLLTGRHHQIRAQLAAIHCHIKGDLKYGARRSNEDGSICLHAQKIQFIHPVSKSPVSIFAPPFNPLFFSLLENNAT